MVADLHHKNQLDARQVILGGGVEGNVQETGISEVDTGVDLVGGDVPGKRESVM